MPELGISLKLLMRAVRREAAAALLSLAGLTLIGSGLAALTPLALKFLLESAAAGGGAQAAMIAFGYAGLMACARIAGEARSAVYGAAEQHVVRALSREALSHALRLPASVHAERSTGEIQQTIENGLLGYRLLLQQALLTIGPGLVEIVILSAIILIWLDAVYLAVFAGFAVAYGAVFAVCAKPVLRAARQTSAARTQAQSQFVDSLMNQETIRLYCGVDAVVERHDRLLSAVQSGWRELYRARLRAGVLMGLVMAAGLLAGLLLALSGIQSGQMGLGDLILVQASLLQIIRPLEMLAASLRDIGQGAAFAGQLSRLLAEPAEAAGSYAGGQDLVDAPAQIRFENVCYTHTVGRGSIKAVSFTLPAGCKAAIVGLSGSGKSTLLRLLLRLLEPAEGQILIDGVPLASLAPEEVRRRITCVLQDSALLDQELGANITFPDGHSDTEKLYAAAAASGLRPLVGRLPEGLCTPVGERGSRLSGGERQRVLLARALYRDTGILVADEPASALDAPSRSRIMRALFNKDASRTVIVVSHRLSEVAGADLILVMKDGRLAEQGRHSELLARNGHYSAIWHQQT